MAGTPFSLTANNPAYVGQYLSDCTNPNATVGANCSFSAQNSMYNPAYKSPRSIQMNIGIQRELRKGMVLSADFVRNVQTHYLLGVDQNHAGDIRYFRKAAAQQAIANVIANCGGGVSTVAGTYSANASWTHQPGQAIKELRAPACHHVRLCRSGLGFFPRSGGK